MPIRVKSEIGKLKRVLVHRPGLELEHLMPGALERLLFDDIPYLRGAQAEHDRFCETLTCQRVEVCYLADLAAETIAQSPALRETFVREFIAAAGSAAYCYRRELAAFFDAIADARELILKTMAGVNADELPRGGGDSLSALLNGGDHFILDPIPNLYFTRDPFASIGAGASVNRMYAVTRNRETIYGRYILEHHPDYMDQVPFYYLPDEPFSLEGGDILNLSNRVLAVGVSQRTKPEAVETLARNIFADPTAEIDTVLALDIPSMRAFMHLDTVLTQIDRDIFLVHPGILAALRIFELKSAENGALRVRELSEGLDRVLARYLDLPSVRLLNCGGTNRIAAEREQWNDGSNALSISPGVVVAYDRNHITNDIMEAEGVTVLKIPSAELSRGRGGPRCMSMPLWRE